MAIYYKFKSAKDYDSVVLDGPFITVGALKQKIFEAKYKGKKNVDSKKKNSHESNGLCLGTDLDLVVVNALTNEEYCEESMLIPTNTSVLLRRVPGNRRRRPIDTTPIVVGPPPKAANVLDNNASATPENGNEWDCHDFGEDVYAVSVPGVLPVQSKTAADSREDEEERIKALVNTPALVYADGGADFGAKTTLSTSSSGGRGFWRTPPKGYVCHRCNVPGHLIQDCPTNGDPKYDFKRVRPPTGIPKSMLVTDPDGNYKLPGGTCAVLKPNETAFNREMEGISSSSSSRSTVTTSIPPELYCPLCKQVMKDAVLTSKCCFQSFCDKCIRSHIINSNLKCVCGATGVLTDHLVPNVTVRETIKRILESGSSSSSSGEKATTSAIRDANVESGVSGAAMHSAHNTEQLAPKASDVQESTAMKGSAPSRGSPLTEKKEVQYKTVSTETKKKRKRSSYQDSGSGSYTYMMPMEAYAYNPNWNGVQPGMEQYMGPYVNAMSYSYMRY